MQDQHTPGPWIADTGAIYAASQLDQRGMTREQPIAEVGDQPNYKANARLIAAAPDLLAALQWMVEHDETNEGDVPLPDHNGLTWNEINAEFIDGLNKARAAIAKATGDQPA